VLTPALLTLVASHNKKHRELGAFRSRLIKCRLTLHRTDARAPSGVACIFLTLGRSILMPLEHWEPNPPSGQDNSASSQRRLSNSAPITKPLPSPATPLPAALVPIAEAIREGTPKLSGDAARQAQQLVRDWTPEISRHGLTSTTLVRDQTASQRRITLASLRLRDRCSRASGPRRRRKTRSTVFSRDRRP
jgi:hypothetical protein